MRVKDRPVAATKIYEVNITGLSHNGEGVGKIKGFTVFVPGAIPGETVLARITEVRSNYARATLEEIVTPSAHRATPACPVFWKCGGCQLQHIEYLRQLELKRELVTQALRRIGHLECEVLPVMGMDNPWHYRNKGQFHAGKNDGRVFFGFFKPGSYEAVPARDCLLFSPAVNNLLGYLEQSLTESGVEVYHPETGHGWLRNLVIRESSATGEMMAVFVTTHEKSLNSYCLQSLGEAFPQVTSVYQNINPGRSPLALGPKFRLLAGKPEITDKIEHLSFEISPGSFFQVNHVQTEVLYRIVREFAELNGTETVLDAYSGVGTIALFLAERAKKVIAVEENEKAVADAQKNARGNGIKNVRFIAQRVEDWVTNAALDHERPDVAVVDPPRQGLNRGFLQALVTMSPARLVYVSCNPATLARDLGHLANQGYTINAVQPVDMFPQTGHVETVVLLKKNNRG
ncbi:MAG TPA: 23S rRNA (uracil(1939)-C(5))-methyltransferase RlmD [Syntrophothermus lipocalidus]|nr:23S rRNA (uracil(1939)-C(5))-methyltransferase RlmD [Syntrophothermus lipocalidus]